MSPCQRSLRHLRERGWTACIVEKYNHFARVRQDAFSFGDILAMHSQRNEIALVQTTTQKNMGSRRKKILSLKESEEWMMCGGKIFLHGWKGSKLYEEKL